MYFELKDFLNIADVNKQFRRAAKYLFIWKNSQKEIEIITNRKEFIWLGSFEQLVISLHPGKVFGMKIYPNPNGRQRKETQSLIVH